MAKMEMDIINTHCAGIDIGSRSHFVATGQELHDVKEFGVYAEDLTAICMHLKAHQINSVAITMSICNSVQLLFGLDVHR